MKAQGQTDEWNSESRVRENRLHGLMRGRKTKRQRQRRACPRDCFSPTLLYKRALTVREKNGKDRDPEIAKLTGHLAQTYQSQRKFPEAEVYFRKAIKMNDDLLGPEHPDGLLVMENYAAMLRELKRDAEAAKIEARIKKIRAATATETTKP